ncbi:uncharacterized protein TRAVEDRAFT_22893 [Trametes versicolor FP-101664 SS1]|uniref:uncharacterized protein n=1 Tax=Trametes versicolor (strain FP-101664) TaxID=717944 RepID=UPI0004623182|nr:uncharacterized protein TRAVEDRAFT_22893 [Trametes versicolor FP-101664 SS1]EIW55121.1 hypothetical protein TRAVEDRAFT_22893 [Trametes versicolor FP-101664 SS1]
MASVAADVLVLIATLMRTWSMWAEAARINFTSTFATILMRNDKFLDLHGVQIDAKTQMQLVEPMSTWIAICLVLMSTSALSSPSVTAIPTSRFILDLHRAADTLGVAGDTPQGGEIGTLIFRGSESATASRARSARTREVYGMVFTHATATIEREGE